MSYLVGVGALKTIKFLKKQYITKALKRFLFGFKAYTKKQDVVCLIKSSKYHLYFKTVVQKRIYFGFTCEKSDIILRGKTHITHKSCDRLIDTIDSEAVRGFKCRKNKRELDRIHKSLPSTLLPTLASYSWFLATYFFHDSFKTENNNTPFESECGLKSKIDDLRQKTRELRTIALFAPLPNLSQSSLKLRELIEHVLKFDGQNVSVTQFIRACRRALEPLLAGFSTEMDASLTRLLLSNLSGHTYLVTESLRIHNVENPIGRIKDAFLPSRGSNYYRGQHATEFMRPGEHMLDYFGRIKELTQSVINETTKNSVRVERRVELDIEKEGLDALITGLPQDYKTAYKFEYYSNFDEILICLLRIDKQIKKEDSKRGISIVGNRVANIKPINKSINCSYCKKDGHLENSCRQKKGYPSSSKPEPKSPSKPQNPTKSESSSKRKILIEKCQYCKNFGYLILECRKLKYKIENLNSGNLKGETAKEASRSLPPKERPKSFSPRLTGHVTLIIDTGAEVNLLKKNCIKPLTKIDRTDLLQLTGITLEKQSTLGTLVIRIFGDDVLFHVVDENFPIYFDGILGMDFLVSRSAINNNTLRCLNFKNMSVPFSRSEKGYMPLLQLLAGIYAGEALIKNNNGKGFFKITNTTSKQYMFEIPRLDLSDFSRDILLNSGSNTVYKTTDPDSSEILSFIHTIFTEKNGEECSKLNTLKAKPSFTSSRAESVKALLRFDYLNLKVTRSFFKLSARGLCTPYCLRVECTIDWFRLGISNKLVPAHEKFYERQKYEATGGSNRA
ncbi:hypothetical protein M0804_013546 [Polistes exclamans]|nr:hypothetical protein M0804_013546 [Polistes exclamans]